MVFIFHHSLMDTKSAISHYDFLEAYMNECETSDIVRCPSDDLIPPIEDLYTLSVSEGYLRSHEKYVEPPPNSWKGSPQFTPLNTRFSSLWLSYDEPETLITLSLSEKEKSSVTAVLHTLIAKCIFAVLPPVYTTLQSDCAMSLRKFLPEPVTPFTLGCYVGSLSLTYERASSLNWDEARRTKMSIECIMPQRGSDMSVR
jgi:hypothetical protein